MTIHRPTFTPLHRALAGIGLVLTTSTPAMAELIISEYVEGLGNNKAIEIYNAGSEAVDLAAQAYALRMYFNGSVTPGLTIGLTGSIPAGGTHVVAHASADAAILALANQTNASSWFNGDDAVLLAKAGTPIDVIGQIGVDPGTEWGTGLTSTADNTLRRKATVSSGDASGADAFDPAIGWDGFATNDFSGLGKHQASTGSDGEGGGTGGEDVSACDAPFTPIGAIQGAGPVAALTGPRTTRGVVIADFEGPAPALRGFYIQDPQGDGDVLTSDGLFVFNGNNDNVNLGDLVQVSGTVGEFQGQTQLSATAISVCGAGLVAPTDVTLPLTDAETLERVEGMLVRLPQTLHVTEHFQLGRFGQVVLSSGAPLVQPTQVVLPGDAAVALQAENALNRIILDDARNNQNPDPVLFGRHGLPLTADNTLRIGDTLSDVVGVMTYTWAGNSASGNAWRVRPFNVLGATTPIFEPSNPRPAGAPAVGGALRVAGFNVLNYFVSLDRPSGDVGDNACGPANSMECRGADSLEEFDRQRAKLIAALASLDADIIGLVELENSTGADAAADLVSGLNAALGGDQYAYIDTGVIGGDAIRVGILYRPAAVSPLGEHAVLDEQADPRFDSSRNRPSLAQSFSDTRNGSRFTVVVNHFKSKGDSGLASGVCADVNLAIGLDDCDPGDGQGYWNGTRTRAAEALADWLATDPTGVADPDFVLLGDFNAYAREDPIRVLESAGYTNLAPYFGGASAYSYVFDGQRGALDHALASSSLIAQVVGATEHHINADEPNVLDYNLEFKSPAQQLDWFNEDGFRTSDHDPIVVGINPDGLAPILTLSATPQVLWPANHKLVTVRVTPQVRDDSDPSPRVELVSVTSSEPDNGLGDGDTAGDIEIVDDTTFRLRSERAGNGDGRVYTITYSASDRAGNRTLASTEVRVPHSRGR